MVLAMGTRCCPPPCTVRCKHWSCDSGEAPFEARKFPLEPKGRLRPTGCTFPVQTLVTSGNSLQRPLPWRSCSAGHFEDVKWPWNL